jgi:hypothetical protein
VDEHTTERLLNRFLPFLRYDSCEAFFADSAAEWTDNTSNVLRGPRPPGGTQLEVIAAVEAGAAPDRLSLELLGGLGRPARPGCLRRACAPVGRRSLQLPPQAPVPTATKKLRLLGDESPFINRLKCRIALANSQWNP